MDLPRQRNRKIYKPGFFYNVMKYENRPVRLKFKLGFLKDEILAIQGIKLQEFIRMLAKNYNGKIWYLGSETFMYDMREIFGMENGDSLIFSMQDLQLETFFTSKRRAERLKLALEKTSLEFQKQKTIKLL